MTGAALSTTAQAALERVRVNIDAIATVVAVEPFQTPAQVERANLLLRTVDTLGDDLLAAYDAEKRPHLDQVQGIDRAFKGAKADVKRVSGILRKAIADYRIEQDRERERALEAAQAAARAQDAIAANAAILAIPVAPALEGTSERWTYEVDEVTDWRLVPERFLCLIQGEIRDEIRDANKAGRPPSVPGITFRRALGLAVGRL